MRTQFQNASIVRFILMPTSQQFVSFNHNEIELSSLRHLCWHIAESFCCVFLETVIQSTFSLSNFINLIKQIVLQKPWLIKIRLISVHWKRMMNSRSSPLKVIHCSNLCILFMFFVESSSACNRRAHRVGCALISIWLAFLSTKIVFSLLHSRMGRIQPRWRRGKCVGRQLGWRQCGRRFQQSTARPIGKPEKR